MEFIGFAIAIAVGVVAVTVHFARWARAREDWQEVARRLGLAFEKGGVLRSDSVTGRLGSRSVRLDRFSRGSGKTRQTFTRVRIDARGRVPRDLTIGPEGFVASIQKAFGGQDVETGDLAFDDKARVRGDEARSIALLGEAVRRRLLARLPEFTVRNGEVYYEERGYGVGASRIASLIEDMAELSNALEIEDSEIPARLLENVRADGEAAVRRKSIEALAARHSDRKECAEAARHALRDRDAGTRLAAAEVAGGDAAFEAAEAVVADPSAPAETRARAIEFVARRFDAGRAGPVVAGALGEEGPVALSAARAAGRLRYAPAVPRLSSLARAARVDVAREIVIALGAIGDPNGEQAAIEALEAADDGVRVAAARTLAKIGTVAAVEPLLPLTKGILPAGELRAAAAAAVRAIQSRLRPGERGSLSVTEILSADGSLSLPEDEAGRVSLEDPARRAGEAEPP